MTVPPRGFAERPVTGRISRSERMGVRIRMEAAHVVAVDQVNGAVLAGRHQKVRVRTGLIGQKHRATGTQIVIP
jgi:hypothetical protein